MVDDSPFKPLWRRDTKSGKERHTGDVHINGLKYWVQVFPNTQRQHEKQPTYHVVIQPSRAAGESGRSSG